MDGTSQQSHGIFGRQRTVHEATICFLFHDLVFLVARHLGEAIATVDDRGIHDLGACQKEVFICKQINILSICSEEPVWPAEIIGRCRGGLLIVRLAMHHGIVSGDVSKRKAGL